MFTVIVPFLQKQKSLNPWTRTKLEGKKNMIFIEQKKCIRETVFIKKKKRGEQKKLSFN